MHPNLLSRFRLASPGEVLHINILLSFAEHKPLDEEIKGQDIINYIFT